MKRAPIVIGATAAGLAAVLAFHTAPNTVNLGGALGSGTSKSASGGSVATGPPATGTGSGSNKSTSSGSKTSSTSAVRTATGPDVNYFYGDLSVSVTVSGNLITKVTIASLNDGGNFRSQSIDQQSIPLLEQETLQAKSANIQGVSGATYTSAGFEQSLQGALKKLGL